MKFQLSNLGERPDFRIVITFLWSECHNVDSDGDADNPASRSWTRLYCRDRSSPFASFVIGPIATDPLVLGLESEDPNIAARVALFLHRETGCDVRLDGKLVEAGELIERCGKDFDLDEAFSRSSNSVWRKSSLDNPYPNLDA